jgi:hypothetical protein
MLEFSRHAQCARELDARMVAADPTIAVPD